MNAKHTPGPWFVGAQNDSLYVLDAAPSPAPYDGPIPREYGPNVVATPNFRIAGYEANARLIAAAPDLLAALTAMQQAYGRLHDFLSDTIEGGRLTQADIPDDYQAIVSQLEKCCAADEVAKAALASVRSKTEGGA